MRGPLVALALFLAGTPAAAQEHGAPDLGAPPLLYELPEAGSYELPTIERVSDHQLLDPTGQVRPLLGLSPGSCALVAFVYLHCTDASGCPLALASLQRADRAIAARPDLRDRVRLVTVSFDPARDTPEAMAGLRHHMSPKGEWRFLTARDETSIRPVLVDYGQDAVPLLTGGGQDTGLLRHVTKVFLVDGEGRVRNVYSSGFLDHRLLLRDVETVLGVATPPGPGGD
ncbi:MAG: SCO family protein [Myxococcota bacterium]|nr:SCO family protein [Myxococcota bacterium]